MCRGIQTAGMMDRWKRGNSKLIQGFTVSAEIYFPSKLQNSQIFQKKINVYSAQLFHSFTYISMILKPQALFYVFSTAVGNYNLIYTVHISILLRQTNKCTHCL
jgi:hypothetical protein